VGDARASIIVGIDPGTAVTGFAVVRARGNRITAAAWGCWRTKPADAIGHRLAGLVAQLDTLLEEWSPDALALEQAFFGKNVQSALRLGEARGALLAAAARRDVDVVEYPTASVKKRVVGNGRADKTQVQFMLQRLLHLEEPPRPLDASDALALAYALACDRAWLGASGVGP